MAAPNQNFRPATAINAQMNHAPETPRTGPTQDKQENFIQSTFKRDVSKAREILTDLLKKAATLLQENTKQPGNQKDLQRLRLEKGIEELFAVLDQVEINLKLAIQWHTQSLDSRKNVSLPVASKKTDDAQIHPKKTILLQDYMKVVKHQIQSAKELHDVLTDSENKLTRTGSLQSSAAPNILTPTGSKAQIH